VSVFVAVLAGIVLDIAVLLAVGQAIGVRPTVLLLLLGAVLGVVLIRREGRRTLAAFGDAVLTGRMPHREMADGVLIAAAGVLVILPGLISDALALTLLYPPTRAVVRERMVRRAERAAERRDQGGTFVVDSVVVDAPDVDDHGGPADRGERTAPMALPSAERDRRGGE
jgi:UPF0716 protein FxsA